MEGISICPSETNRSNFCLFLLLMGNFWLCTQGLLLEILRGPYGAWVQIWVGHVQEKCPTSCTLIPNGWPFTNIHLCPPQAGCLNSLEVGIHPGWGGGASNQKSLKNEAFFHAAVIFN